MRGAWRDIQVRIALAWRALLIDLNNFYLLQHRGVTGHLISGKNSGTHWLRFMLSHALARRHGLPPPARSSGRLSEDFVGHPRWPRRRPGAPFIASSHNLPSTVFRWAWVRRLMRLPPIVVLVRDPKQAMLSHFVKWREHLSLTMHDYVHRASTKRRQLANAWWYIDFFNRWGRIAASAPQAVLVVRYEDLQAAPAFWLDRISTHLGLDLDASAIDAAMAVCSREALRETLDPAYGETIVPAAADRAEARFSPADDRALSDQFAAHLRFDFGYGHARRPIPRASAPGAGVLWARAALLLTAAWAVFDQFGRPYLELSVVGPWGRAELASIFFFLTLLAPLSFPRLKALAPAVLSIAGGGVELAQYAGLAPGIGTMTDVLAEVGGVAAAVGLVLAIETATAGGRSRQAVSSPGSSSAARAAEARPERPPR